MTDRARKPSLAATRLVAPHAQATPRVRAAAETKRELEAAAGVHGAQRYVLRLYVTGTTPASTRAIEKVRAICEEHLQGRCELEVIDIYQTPALARDHQIIATPTLIKMLPAPLRRFIGDLSKADKALFGLDIREKGG